MSFVLDASVALAWCFEAEQTPALMELLDRTTETGASAPLLWPLEVLNGLFVAERRRRLGASEREKLAGFLRDLPVRLDMETAARVWEPAAQFAEQFKLSVYDACYLELAQRGRLPIASLTAACGAPLPRSAWRCCSARSEQEVNGSRRS